MPANLPMFVTTALAGPRERRHTLLAVLASAALFVAAIPYATVALPAIPAFIPAYESALVVCDLVTAALLFSQFSVLRLRSLLVLASGYLFTAIIAFVHALTFPGAFAPTGLLGAGPQSTAWLYMVWHAVFPLYVILYALLKVDGVNAGAPGAERGVARGRPRSEIAVAIVITIAIAGVFMTWATTRHAALPALMAGNRFTPTMTVVVTGVWLTSLLAIAVLWRRRPHSVIDLWLMGVLCAWLFDIALAAVFNEGRYDLGWYAGRIYGLLAASFLLVVLLVENGSHYARLALLSESLGDANRALEQLSRQDGLTGLANRRYFDTYLEAQIAAARRYERPLALVLCDVDAFKAFNDHYGHQAGDDCLVQVAGAIRSCCHRPADLAARYGGEEFALVLPDTDLAGATRIAECLRDAVARLAIAHLHSRTAKHVSISGGVACLPADGNATAQQLIAAADERLYEAKHRGRNRMVGLQAEAA